MLRSTLHFSVALLAGACGSPERAPAPLLEAPEPTAEVRPADRFDAVSGFPGECDIDVARSSIRPLAVEESETHAGWRLASPRGYEPLGPLHVYVDASHSGPGPARVAYGQTRRYAGATHHYFGVASLHGEHLVLVRTPLVEGSSSFCTATQIVASKDEAWVVVKQRNASGSTAFVLHAPYLPRDPLRVQEFPELFHSEARGIRMRPSTGGEVFGAFQNTRLGSIEGLGCPRRRYTFPAHAQLTDRSPEWVLASVPAARGWNLWASRGSENPRQLFDASRNAGWARSDGEHLIWAEGVGASNDGLQWPTYRLMASTGDLDDLTPRVLGEESLANLGAPSGVGQGRAWWVTASGAVLYNLRAQSEDAVIGGTPVTGLVLGEEEVGVVRRGRRIEDSSFEVRRYREL
ncbi:MAG: hypothetical protein AAGF12_24170 [Myxococcota bacterium]